MFRAGDCLDEPDLTLEEIKHWIRKFRYDQDYGCGRRRTRQVPIVPLKPLCEFAGVPYSNVYAVLRGELGLTANQRRRLSAAIRAVWAGLRWKRLNDGTLVLDDPGRWERLPKYERQRKGGAAQARAR
jgi:hypothetical protein